MPTPTPAKPPTDADATKFPRALLFVAGAGAIAIVLAVWIARGKSGNAPSTSEVARDEEATGVPKRAALRSRPKREADDTQTDIPPPPPPADLSEVDALVEKDPEAALSWIASLKPDDDVAAERLAAAEVRALVAVGKIGKARGKTLRYYRRFPNGPNTTALEALTGAHRADDAADAQR